MQYRIDFYLVGELTEREQEKIIGLLDFLELQNIIISNEKDNPEIFM